VKLPWTTLEKGQGFFIPALDLDATREAGLLEAVKVRVLDAQALYCLHNGMQGVLFYRKPIASSPSSRRKPAGTSEQPAPAERPGA